MSFHLGRITGWDLETTGPDPFEARVVTSSLVYHEPDGSFSGVDHLVNPGVEIPEGAAKVHGITTEYAVEHGADPAVALTEIRNALVNSFAAGIPVCAFNGAYDFTVLEQDLARHGLPSITVDCPIFPVIDPHVIDKQADKYRKGKRTLGITAAHYGVELLDAHTSSADALAAVLIARELPLRFPALAVHADVLHGWTVTWRAQQAASLQAYFRKTKPDTVVSGEWPVQSQ